MSPTEVFVVVNIIGGICVLSSYAYELLVHPRYRLALWGGVSGTTRNIFIVSMLPSAIGYLMFFYYMSFTAGMSLFVDSYSMPIMRYAPTILATIFLASSSLWMPSTMHYLHSQRVVWWHITVSSLWLTAFSLLLLTLLLIFTDNGIDSLTRYLGIGGLVYITFHCLVMDAFIWTRKFPNLLS